MDSEKKDLLTQSVSYFQSHLIITTELLRELKEASLLTPHDLTLIKNDETNSGKVLELLCIIKRKSNRSFERFIKVLEKNQYGSLVSLCQKTLISPDKAFNLVDPRTVEYLDKVLGQKVSGTKIHKLAAQLVLREIYEDALATHQDMSSGTASPEETATLLEQSDIDKLFFQLKEKDRLLEHKNVMINEKDGKLKELFEELETVSAQIDHYHGLLDLSSRRSFDGAKANYSQYAGEMREISDLREESMEAQKKIEELEAELVHIDEQLLATEKEKEQLRANEHYYKKLLGLREDVEGPAIEACIRKLVTEDKVQRRQIDEFKKNLKMIECEKIQTQAKVKALEQEKTKLQLDMRNQQYFLKRYEQQRRATIVFKTNKTDIKLDQRHQMPKRQVLPQIERPTGSASRRGRDKKYCMLCCEEFQPLKHTKCRVHYQPIREGKWGCCQDDRCQRGTGCLQVPHLYIEITVARKILLTDGARYFELS